MDLVADGCDICPNDDLNDEDGDLYCPGAGFNPPAVGDQDNCPIDTNPTQVDTDADGEGDACDVCTNVADAQTATGVAVVKLKGTNSSTAADDVMIAKGFINLPNMGVFADLDPPMKPVSTSVESGTGVLRYSFRVPTEAYAGKGTRGWRASESGRRWNYLDRTSAPLGGLTRLLLVQTGTPGVVRFKIKNRGGGIAVENGDEPIRLLLDAGDAGAGECTEVVFGPGDCKFKSPKNLLCRQ